MGRGRETVSSVPRPALIPRRAITVVRAFRFRSIRVACFSPSVWDQRKEAEAPVPNHPFVFRSRKGWRDRNYVFLANLGKYSLREYIERVYFTQIDWFGFVWKGKRR